MVVYAVMNELAKRREIAPITDEATAAAIFAPMQVCSSSQGGFSSMAGAKLDGREDCGFNPLSPGATRPLLAD